MIITALFINVKTCPSIGECFSFSRILNNIQQFKRQVRMYKHKNILKNQVARFTYMQCHVIFVKMQKNFFSVFILSTGMRHTPQPAFLSNSSGAGGFLIGRTQVSSETLAAKEFHPQFFKHCRTERGPRRKLGYMVDIKQASHTQYLPQGAIARYFSNTIHGYFPSKAGKSIDSTCVCVYM